MFELAKLLSDSLVDLSYSTSRGTWHQVSYILPHSREDEHQILFSLEYWKNIMKQNQHQYPAKEIENYKEGHTIGVSVTSQWRHSSNT
jgi:hypothetical protein